MKQWLLNGTDIKLQTLKLLTAILQLQLFLDAATRITVTMLANDHRVAIHGLRTEHIKLWHANLSHTRNIVKVLFY